MFGAHFHNFFFFPLLLVTPCKQNLSPQDEVSSLRAFEQRPAEVGLIWQRAGVGVGVGVVRSVCRMTLLTCLLAQRRCCPICEDEQLSLHKHITHIDIIPHVFSPC